MIYLLVKIKINLKKLQIKHLNLNTYLVVLKSKRCYKFIFLNKIKKF